MGQAGMRPEGTGAAGGDQPEPNRARVPVDRNGVVPLVPLVARDDAVAEPLDGFAPSFHRGSERPVTAHDEATFAAVPGCSVILSSRVPGTLSWLDAWRGPARCTATVTAGRVVFGCRPYRGNPGHPQAGKILGGQLRYESVSRVGIWIAPGAGDSHLLIYARDQWRQWRLAIGSPDLTQEGPQLAEEVAVAVARAHLAMGQPEADVAGQLWACADGVRLRPARGHGVTVTLPGERPMPVPPVLR